MHRALYLDRDGILNKVVIRDGVVGSPRDKTEFEILEDAHYLTDMAIDLGFKSIVISNQPDVDRGLMTLEKLERINDLLRDELLIEHIEFCTSGDDEHHGRKPNPGMLLDTAHMYKINLKESFFVGDGWKDVKAGKMAGVKTILLQTDYNKEIHGSADYNCNSIKEIVELIKSLNEKAENAH